MGCTIFRIVIGLREVSQIHINKLRPCRIKCVFKGVQGRLLRREMMANFRASSIAQKRGIICSFPIDLFAPNFLAIRAE